MLNQADKVKHNIFRFVCSTYPQCLEHFYIFLYCTLFVNKRPDCFQVPVMMLPDVPWYLKHFERQPPYRIHYATTQWLFSTVLKRTSCRHPTPLLPLTGGHGRCALLSISKLVARVDAKFSSRRVQTTHGCSRYSPVRNHARRISSHFCTSLLFHFLHTITLMSYLLHTSDLKPVLDCNVVKLIWLMVMMKQNTKFRFQNKF